MSQASQGRDDFELMQAICRRETAAFSELYDRHSPLLFAICRRVLGNAADAEDALVDIFFEVWNRADRYDPVRGCPLTYLITLTRSRAIDRRRSQASQQRIIDGAAQAVSQADPAQTIDINEQRQIVRQALSQLVPQQRESLECAFFDGLSHSEIAEKLGKPLGTIKTYIRQGLIQLRQSLRIQEDDKRGSQS